jgi:hypothetical protein
MRSERRSNSAVFRCHRRNAAMAFWLLTFGCASICWPQPYQHHVGASWDFKTASNPLGWSPIDPLSNFGIHNQALTFTATSQVAIVYSPAIKIPTQQMQLVEIVMSSDTAGAAEVFWAPSPSVKNGQVGYTGFQAGDENDFTMAGDGAFHHYYLPIGPSTATTIYRLRLDVPPGATISMQSIDVANLVAPSGPGVNPRWQFNSNGDSLGWIPYSGIVDMTVSGGSLHLQTFANATILAPNAQITNQLEWFSVFAKVTHTQLETPWVLFNFVSVANNGAATNVYFPVVPDSADHVYNQNVGGENGWWSKVSQLSITISENTTVAVSQIQFSDAPQGPADLAIDAFGAATSFIRAGTPFQVSCRVSDRGAENLEHLSVQLKLPSDGSVKIVSSPSVSESLANGYPQRLEWTLLAKESGTIPISVEATSQSGSARGSANLLVNPKVSAQKSTYVPRPVPAPSDYDVGLYYFPGWSLFSHWDPIRNFPERTPALGYYAEGDPQVLDWQIKWAVEHGVNFFAVDWYWDSSGQNVPPGEQPNNFLQAYSASVYRKYIKFCLAYADGNGTTAGSTAEFMKIAQAWIKEYFSQPGYLKIDGKPVVVIIGPGSLDDNLGGSSARALEDARQLARDAGLGGIYFVASAIPSQASEFQADGYDAVSAYNYPSAGTNDPDESPYSGMVSGYSGVWDAMISETNLPYIIPTSPGWDNRPWATYDTSFDLVRTGSTPELFEQMLQNAKTLIDTGMAPHVVLVEAWNELGEGSYVEPTAGLGFGALDAIRDVFASNSTHTDVVPSDVGLPTPQVQPATSLWTFTNASDLLPWQPSLGPPFWGWTTGVSNSQIANNQWTFTSSGYADLLRMGFELSAQQYSGIAITMSASADTWVSAFWGADDEPGPSAVRNSSFAAQPGPMQTYTLPLAGLAGWRGNINLLRLTMSTSPNVKVAIKSIEFIPSSSVTAIAASRAQLEFRWTAGTDAPAPQIVSVGSATQSNLSWVAAAEKAPWLFVSPAKGAAPGNISVTIHPTGLAIGIHSGEIKISAAGAANSPLTLPVTLWVMPPP